jgi:hypothetical protein
LEIAAVNETKMRLSRNRLEELLQELKAINFWDRHYECVSEHDFINAFAWIARRRRALEIKMEINEFYGESGRAHRVQCARLMTYQWPDNIRELVYNGFW